MVGETPNLAARLQAWPPPAAWIRGFYRRLLAGTVRADAPRAASPEGSRSPVPAWRSDARPRRTVSGVAVASHDALRWAGAELALLLDRWRDAAQGEGQAVGCRARPASASLWRVIATLRERIGSGHNIALRYHCSPHHSSDAFYPIIGQLWHAAGFASGEPAVTRLDKLEALIARSGLDAKDIAPFVAALLSISGESRYPALEMAPG